MEDTRVAESWWMEGPRMARLGEEGNASKLTQNGGFMHGKDWRTRKRLVQGRVKQLPLQILAPL